MLVANNGKVPATPTQASSVGAGVRSALEHSRNPKLKSPARDLFETPMKRTQSTIKKSHVTKAAFPQFVGMTPQPYNDDDEFGMKAGSPEKRTLQDYTEKQRMSMTAGNFAPRALDSPDRRRMNANEYRGPNLSDCMYHTMTAFKQGAARNSMKPTEKPSLDAAFPATGVQAL